jgi:replication factor A1
MRICDVKAGQKQIAIDAIVLEKSEVREFVKFGRPGRVCNAVIGDKNGKIKLTLWNEEVDIIKVGDKIRIEDSYVSEYKGEMQISLGREGTITVTN